MFGFDRPKTPRAHALGVFVCAWSFTAVVAACDMPEKLEREVVNVAKVQDGDSIRLTDGRRVRLIGVNAPELQREQRSAQPLASSAHDYLRERLADEESVTLVYGPDRKDHYGRTLAYVFTSDEDSVEADLLLQGLAFHIAIPPNTTLAECLAEAEARARRAARGVWGHEGWKARSAATLTTEDTGFQRLKGRIVDISVAGGSVWLELDGPVVLQVPRELWSQLQASGLSAGEVVEVRGWIVDRSDSSAAKRGFKPMLLRVRSRYDLSLVECCPA